MKRRLQNKLNWSLTISDPEVRKCSQERPGENCLQPLNSMSKYLMYNATLAEAGYYILHTFLQQRIN